MFFQQQASTIEEFSSAGAKKSMPHEQHTSKVATLVAQQNN